MFCVYFSCWYCVQHIHSYPWFSFYYCFVFFMLAIRHFFARLAKKTSFIFSKQFGFWEGGRKRKNVVFSWWAVCEFKECENFKGWDTCSTKLYYFFIGQKNKHFSELIYLFSLCKKKQNWKLKMCVFFLKKEQKMPYTCAATYVNWFFWKAQ